LELIIIKAVIIDGYVDEPAVLGVPPYVSPYIRYNAGAFFSNGIEVDYYTIDQIRELDFFQFLNNYDYLVIIAGTTVPGHYFRGSPITLNEIKKLFTINKNPLRVLGGPITKGYTITGGKAAKVIADYLEEEYDYIVEGSLENFLLKYPISEDFDLKSKSSYEITDKLSVMGAEILKKHPFYPNIIVELEISKGCDRTEGFCSFCTEPLMYGIYNERKVENIIEEIKALNNIGIKNFRFGRSANFLAYGKTFNKGNPNPKIFEELYSEAFKYSEILHTDNANPKYIVDNEKEVRKILETIVKYNSAGDVLSFGVESFDEEVIRENNISIFPEETFKAIKIVNEIGGIRDKNNVPKLLPGINILYGLIGETKKTYEKNKSYLEKIYSSDMLVRRINVRQVMEFPNTKLANSKDKKKVSKKLFFDFKNFMEEYNNKMIQKVFPMGTVLENIIIEKKANISFGRQLGTYPILCGINKEIELYKKINGIVVNHGSRSLTVVEKPFSFEKSTLEEITAIKGIGKKAAQKIKFEKNIEFLENKQKEIIMNLSKII